RGEQRPASRRLDEISPLLGGRKQRTQSGKAVRRGYARTSELGEPALDKCRQESRRLHDLVEERGAALFQRFLDRLRFGGELGARIGRDFPNVRMLALQERDR